MIHPVKLVSIFLLSTTLYASNETFEISDATLEKIHANEFVNVKKTFAESPSLFQQEHNFNIPNAIAFEDSKKITLTPGDVIKISEDLTFSDWGGNSTDSHVAEEDFVLSKDKLKKTEDDGEIAPKTKNIKFSHSVPSR